MALTIDPEVVLNMFQSGSVSIGSFVAGNSSAAVKFVSENAQNFSKIANNLATDFSSKAPDSIGTGASADKGSALLS